MNIQQFEYIIAVSELRNFGQAAEKCFITQSTLSTMIARFEDEIGITIFDRKKKPVMVTKEGEPIIRQLKIISKEIDQLKEQIDSLKGKSNGIFKIGIIPTVAPYLLPLFLNKLAKKHPTIHFVISELPTEKIIEKLENRDLDVGIVSIPLNHAALKEIQLYQEPFLLFDKANQPIKGACKISEIEFDRLWLLEEGHCMRTQVTKICNLLEQHDINRNLDYKSGTIDTLLKFVKRNEGITLLPLLATLDLSKEEQRYLKEFESPIPARSIGLVMHEYFIKKDTLNSLQQEIQKEVFPLLQSMEAHLNVISPLAK